MVFRDDPCVTRGQVVDCLEWAEADSIILYTTDLVAARFGNVWVNCTRNHTMNVWRLRFETDLHTGFTLGQRPDWNIRVILKWHMIDTA